MHVWINGRFVAFRAGFSTPFELAVPAGIRKKGANEIVMAVSNNPNLGYCGAYVTGLTTRSTFGATGGVNGKLALRFPKNRLSDVYVTTAADLKTFTVHVDGVNDFSYEILDGTKVKEKGSAKGDFALKTAGYEFWSPESPKRYELKITTPEGSYRQKFGIRRLVADGEKLKLNGKAVTGHIEPDVLLIDLLRSLGCLSVKRGCETSNCGLCTVLMDGRPVLSCSMLAARADGHEVYTLEGLTKEAEAFVGFIADEGADQCGFCNPGYVMNTIALLRENPDPTDEEIRAWLAGNLCRCSGYDGQLRGIRAYLQAKKEGRL